MTVRKSISQFSRRQFLLNSAKYMGTVVTTTGIATGLTACNGGSIKGQFDFGVASGDPLSTSVILWTRITPTEEVFGKAKQKSAKRPTAADTQWASWEVATDRQFRHIVNYDSAATDETRDYTLKIDVQGLQPNTTYYYRFKTATGTSPVGRTKTLPVGSVGQVKLAVISCANYPAGYFHVYREIAKLENIDAIVHLGDYFYEYARGGYASEDAADLGREVLPANELLSLDDYRTRYAQYRSDSDLQAAHASAAFIAIWDDHEVANDTWRKGAENHNEGEGVFIDRMLAALQAYAEWMPIRPPVNEDITSLQRSFAFGDLVHLTMLDTRLVGRDKQLNLVNYFDASGAFDAVAYAADIANPDRTLLGQDQLLWLQGQLVFPCIWQVLGQQVLMGAMELPAAIATQQLSIAEFATLAQLAQVAATTPELLTAQQIALVQEKGPLLQLGSLPYNLDAWDGYPVERANVLATSLQLDNNLVVLAGDTHNAWANNLKLGDEAAGVEFASPSVSSPGLEDYLQLDSEQAVLQTEAGLTQLIPDLKYSNLADRGYMTVTFTASEVTSEWVFVDTIKSLDYSVNAYRGFSITVPAGSNRID